MAMQLVYGVLRQRQRLDRILQLLSRTKLNKLDPFVHQAIAVGLYQIFFLDKIPESAAVNEAVNSLKYTGKPKRLQGFCNGILRESLRQRTELVEKSRTDSNDATILNHPDWMIKRWLKFFGERETSRICVANSQEPQLVLRINTRRKTVAAAMSSFTENGIDCLAGNFSETAVILPGFRGSIASLPGYEEGWFQVQDEAAQLAAHLLGPFQPGGRYLDGCAGLGGKTCHLADLVDDPSIEILAVEPEPYRQKKLCENLQRCDLLPRVQTFQGTLEDIFKTQPQTFDGILIDAPCSGTGVTGRHPDIRWNREPEEFGQYQKRQLELLNISAKMLKPKGVLVYATCSLEPEENAHVVNEFCRRNNNFKITDCKDFLPPAAHCLTEGLFFSPHPQATIDGFFAARLQRCRP